MKLPELIGLSGTFGSGKDLLAGVLAESYGYTHVSTSDLVRQVAMRDRGSIERPILKEIAEECRQKFGGGYFVEQGLQQSGPLVISGIRSLGEMKALKQAGGVMVFVDAPFEIRYNRMVERSRDGESLISHEEFKERESRELCSGPLDTDFNITAIGEQADVNLDNSGTKDEFLQNAINGLKPHGSITQQLGGIND